VPSQGLKSVGTGRCRRRRPCLLQRPRRKHCLLNGLDDIGLTMVKEKKINDFEGKAKAARPWV
jgi:3-isopropylmalate dehydratase small subunit